VWSFATGVTRGHEAAPLMVGDTLYVVTPLVIGPVERKDHVDAHVNALFWYFVARG